MGKELAYTIILAAIFLLMGVFIIVSAVFFRQRKLAILQESDDFKAALEQEKLQIHFEVREQTVDTISRELHDNIAQILSLSVMTISSINPREPDKIQPKLDASEAQLRKAIDEIRQLAKSLNSDIILEEGLEKALQHELQILEKSGLFRTQFCTGGQPWNLPQQKELVLFRVSQEILNNIVKHSKACQVQCNIQYTPDQLNFSLSDNGIGFDANAHQNQPAGARGSGLSNIRKRIALIGGTVDIKSEAGKGTFYEIVIPGQPADP